MISSSRMLAMPMTRLMTGVLSTISVLVLDGSRYLKMLGAPRGSRVC